MIIEDMPPRWGESGSYHGNLKLLLGKTAVSADKFGDDEIHMEFSDGTRLRLYHEQDCCESVTVDDVVGDLQDLVGSPLTMAEDISSEAPVQDEAEMYESFTWTWYKFATLKGYVTIKFYGSSNGYYSEAVSVVIREG